MSNIKYRFTDTEINKLLKENFMIAYDTREQENSHILAYFKHKGIPVKRQKIDEGDYTGIITARPDMGIMRDLYFKVGVERKNGVGELANNLAEKTDTRDDIRLERELLRAKAKGITIFLVIEDKRALEKIRAGEYDSMYNSKAFMGRLSGLQNDYIKDTICCDKQDSGYHIRRKLYYAVRHFLKQGEIIND